MKNYLEPCYLLKQEYSLHKITISNHWLDKRHVHPWQIHVNVWQNQYSIVKQNKVKIKIKKKKKSLPNYDQWAKSGQTHLYWVGQKGRLSFSITSMEKSEWPYWPTQ